jgi:hypothetical protein
MTALVGKTELVNCAVCLRRGTRRGLPRTRIDRCVLRLFYTAMLLTALTASAQSFVAPPESLPGGSSCPQWTAKWRELAWSIPLSINPLFDTSGMDCSMNQSGPVWFLAGTNGTNATRNCVVPSGKNDLSRSSTLGTTIPAWNSVEMRCASAADACRQRCVLTDWQEV